MNKIGMEIKDGCCMLDKNAKLFWSEINQDCMRIRTIDSNESYDKDLWREGGSMKKVNVLSKWIKLNEMLVNYFNKNRFHETEIFLLEKYSYQETIKNILNDKTLRVSSSYVSMYSKLKFNSLKKSRRLIVTLDLFNNQPVLVKSSKVYQVHSDGDVKKALDKISLFSDILIVYKI